ncbi:MAG: hypothetical protein ABJ056_10445 [Halioglobus sp.]
MRVDQIKSLRWLLAELVVIVLGILIAFQVEEWRQERENRVLEAKAFEEVLSDLDSIEMALLRASEITKESTLGAVSLVQLIQSREGSEKEFLESIGALNVYLIGVAKSTHAYDGLLTSGRFAAVENPALTESMRFFFTLRKPWVYSLNASHVEHYNDLMDKISINIRTIPDEDFSSTLSSHDKISVPMNEFLKSPQVMDDLLGFVRRSEGLKELFQMLLDDIQELREDIGLHVATLES